MLKFVLPVMVIMASVLAVQSSKMSFVDADGNKVKTVDVTFNQAENCLLMEESSSAFTVQDFSKGLVVRKYSSDQVCYIESVDASEAASRSALKSEVTVSKKNAMYHVLKSEISDTSFLPSEAVKRCAQGFKWRVQAAKGRSMRRGQAANKGWLGDAWDWAVDTVGDVVEDCSCDVECSLWSFSCGVGCGC